MRIAILNHYADPPFGGKYLRHFHFARKLIARGHSVHIFTASTLHGTERNVSAKDAEFDGVPYHFVRVPRYHSTKSRLYNMAMFTWKLPERVYEEGLFDVLYVSSPHPFIYYAANRIRKRTGAKLVMEIRDLWPETFVSMGAYSKRNLFVRAFYRLEDRIFRGADELIFTMPGGADYLKERGYDRPSTNINNGVDLVEFDKLAKNPSQLPEGNFRVVYTGAFGRVNGLEVLIDAANALADEAIDFYLYGSGDEEEALKARAKSARIHFMGRVEKSEIPAILTSSDLNVFTAAPIDLYRYGMSFNKLFEYLAAGVPILSNLKTRYDILSGENAGLTVAPGDAEAFRDGILKFYRMDEEAYRTYGENARAAAAKYDFEVLTDTLEEVLRRSL